DRRQRDESSRVAQIKPRTKRLSKRVPVNEKGWAEMFAPAPSRRRFLDVSLEDGGFGQAGQALPDAAGPSITDALDSLQVFHRGPQQALQAAEVFHQPFDHGGG